MKTRNHILRVRVVQRAACVLFCLLLTGVMQAQSSFEHQQRRFPRVRKICSRMDSLWRVRFDSLDLSYPARSITIVIYKDPGELEVHVRGDSASVLVKCWPVCMQSGDPGPKRRQGDMQVPEGKYHIDRFNPASAFHLSLGLNYPNRSDRILGDPESPGGDIFIHGGCATIGCIPIGDRNIDELYWLTVRAKTAGQRRIPVLIFPARMDSHRMTVLTHTAEIDGNTTLVAFWRNLRTIYDSWIQHGKPPEVSVDDRGRYRVLSDR